MASVKIDLSLEDTKGSIRRRKGEVQDLNRELEKSRRLGTGTQTGAQALKASFSPSMGDGEGTEYGRARGSMGTTGAAGRDFANQAQGLGGLVRLYATYAANLFAVTAAFTALSQAMNTTNMVRGLDQLGAASGVSLGNLAKQFEEASGGAISLRESMEATAKAVSSGLTQAQFLKLGEVAKQASQALGVGMSDAVSRLTRGITKLEPELLDELGIFTKVGKATEDYAKSIGKSATSLTDFERRQAFANAVLDEGAKKFGEISIPTNPYDKLLASLKNVAQGILEVINVAVVPLVSLLSSSPTALLAIIGAIGLKITNQALPALGQFRAGLQKSAQEALNAAEVFKESFGDEFQATLEQRFRIPDLEADVRNTEAQLKRLKIPGKLPASIEALKEGEMAQAKVNKVLAARNKLIETGMRGTKAATAEQIAAAKQEIVYIEKLKTLYQQKQVLATARAGTEEVADRPQGFLDPQVIALQKYDKLRKQVDVSTAVSNAAQNAQIQGIRGAWTLLNLEIEKKGIAGIDKFTTRVKGGFAAVASRVTGVIGAFGQIGQAIGLAVVAYQFFTSALGKNAREAEKAKEAMGVLDGSIESVSNTINRLNKKPLLESLTSEAISAKATAFSNLTTAFSDALDKVEEEIKNRNVVDTFSNWISGIFGENTEERITRQLIEVINGAVKAASTATQSEDIRKQLAQTLSIPVDSSLSQIAEAAKKASPTIRKEVSKILDTISKSAERSTGSVKSFIDSLEDSGKLYQDLSNSFKASDPLSKFAEDSSKKLTEFSKVLDAADLPSKLALLNSVANDTRFLQLLPLDEAKQVLAISGSIKQLNLEIAEGLGNIRALEEGRVAAQEKLNGPNKDEDIVRLKQAVKEYDKLIDQARKLAEAREITVASKLLEGEKVFNDALRAGLIANIDRFQSGIELAAKKARLELQKVNLQGIVDPRTRIQEETKLEKQGIELDNEQIRSQIDLIESNDKLRLAIQEQTYTERVAQKMREFGVNTELEARFRDPALDKQFRTLEVAQNIQSKSTAQLNAMLKQPGVTSDVLSAIQEALPTARAREGARQKLGQNRIRSEGVDSGAAFKFIDAELKAAEEQYAKMLVDLEFNKQTMTEAEFMRQKAGIQQGMSMLAPAAGVRRAELNQTPGNLEEATRRFEVESATAKVIADRTRNSALELDFLNTVNKYEKRSYTNQLEALDIAKYDLEFKQQSLEKDFASGKLSQDEFNSKKYLLDLEQAGLTRSTALLVEQERYSSAIFEIRKKIAETGGVASPEQIQQIDDAQKATNSATAAINRQYEATKSVLNLNKELTERQTAYADLFTQGFKGMEDAIIEFTKTGKLSFSSMIDNFIEGLIRFEIQQQQMAFLRSMGGASGIAGALINFGSTLFDTNAAGNNMFEAGFNQASPNAKGNAYDYGIQAFAKGGAFTNQIVDSPTLFKFAKGTGLMGEAGPEAIMPLTRDGSGNLGVRAQGGGSNVEVVVNNYSTAKAETKETVDSRGNRRIEVVVGDMVAQEVSRTGSAAQTAFSSTYGTRPALARR